MTTRNINLDIMRLLGLGIIMIAHSFPPGWLFQLRNFGTPLLIIASALTYSHIYANRPLEIKSFYKRRITRLIIPMYVFLSVFFVFFLSLESLLDFDTGFNLKTIVSSYLMIDGIGFVWVFKVYIILAIVTPLALFLMKSKMKNYMYFLFLLIIYVIYECMVVALTGVDNKYVQVFFEKFVLLAIPYSLLYIYGMRLNTLSNKTVILIAVCSLLAFIIIANYLYIDKGNIISTQEYKYPPRIYYLAYAFFAIHFIYLFVMNIKISSSKYLSIISFLSKNSLWIYLWHIFAYYIWFFTMPETEHEIVTSLLMMLYLFLFGVGMSYLQMRLVNHLLESSKNNLINRFYKVLL